MASRMRKRSSCSVASFEVFTALVAPMVAMPASTVMIAITMTSSISVHPACRRDARAATALPVRILGSIEGDPAALRIDIVHVLAAPAARVVVVLVGPHAPLELVRHRIHGDPSEE